jgi:cysteinyl-tRNA synthetase
LALGQVIGLFSVSADEYFRCPTRYTHRAIEAAQAAEAGAGEGVAVSQIGDEDIEARVQARAQAKQQKDFKLADQIRDELAAAGVLLEDKPGGLTQWRRG